MVQLHWYPTNSWDATHDDQEVDLSLDIHGHYPGGASWADVISPEINDPRWQWHTYDWLSAIARPLACGYAATEEEAKQAVADWVDAQKEVTAVQPPD